jgi:hypothetical protein
MRYALYEDPHTHRFTLLPLPSRYVEDDPLPIVPTARWFNTREEAVAALPELLNIEDDASEPGSDERAQNGSRHHH